MNRDVGDEGRQYLIYEWVMQLLADGASEGKSDAADLLLTSLSKSLQKDQLGPKARSVLVDLLTNIVESGESMRFLSPSLTKTRSKRKLSKSVQVVLFVSLALSKGHPARSNSKQVGALDLAAEEFSISVSSARRYWSEGKAMMGNAWVETLESEKPP